MKILHLPNDPFHNDVGNSISGPRDAFERLLREGVLSGLETFLFLAELRSGRDAGEVRAEIISRAKAFQPDIIFWHHIAELPVDEAFFHALRDASSGAMLAYHEGDAFDRYRKRVTPNLRTILTNADIVFTVGLGRLARLLRANGAKDLRFLPHVFDKRRYGRDWDFSERRTYKVSMVGSPWRRFDKRLLVPGVANRIRLAEAMTRIHGKEFSLYGRNWDGLESWRGFLPFDQQVAAIRDSWVSVNWDHFDDFDFYFSDRLPISLVAGVPHVTSHHPGYEDILRDCPGLYAARTVKEAVSKVDWVLSQTPRQLVETGRAAKAWVEANLDADVVFRNAFDICVGKLNKL